MATIIEAMYEHGVLRPLATEGLKEQQRYRLITEESIAPGEPLPATDREQVRDALRAAGLLAELGPNLRAIADPSLSLEEIRAALSRVEGQPLSDIILEQRGPRE